MPNPVPPIFEILSFVFVVAATVFVGGMCMGYLG